MSMKRQPDENPESPDALQALFEQIVTGGPRTCEEWAAVLKTVLSDRWLQAEVRRRAELLVQSHKLHDDIAQDIAQQVFAYLAEKGASDPTLHFKPALLQSGFVAWIGIILNHAASEAARLIGEYRPRHAELRDVNTVEDSQPCITCKIDILAAIERLKGRQKLVMLLFFAGLDRDEIAAQLGLTYKQVRYAIERAMEKMRRWLAAYRE
ncbi:MAG TPA: sigma-70 family RNA polymerase sigma factor [Pirellulales bacterium]|nr:sigma-70 family RNA polymerase sigma factor [Pirellulales bacterium]